MIAENYWTLINERSASLPMEQRIMFYALARNHFIYARNGMRLAELLVEVGVCVKKCVSRLFS